jgi:hypothetical protein
MGETGVNWVLENMQSTDTLLKWCLLLQGRIYDRAGTAASIYSKPLLEEYLNSMIMVAGGKNMLTNTAQKDGPGGGDTYDSHIV